MAQWHPVQSLVVDEWHMRGGGDGIPLGVVRRLEYSKDDVFYRAVTWSTSSASRELVGYFRTLESAAEAIWVYHSARDAERHALMARRALDVDPRLDIKARMRAAGLAAVEAMMVSKRPSAVRPRVSR